MKYGQQMKDGKEETESQMEMNLFVDQVNNMDYLQHAKSLTSDCEDCDAGERGQEDCFLII